MRRQLCACPTVKGEIITTLGYTQKEKKKESIFSNRTKFFWIIKTDMTGVLYYIEEKNMNIHAGKS